jgi:hypothetical protein
MRVVSGLSRWEVEEQWAMIYELPLWFLHPWIQPTLDLKYCG